MIQEIDNQLEIEPIKQDDELEVDLITEIEPITVTEYNELEIEPITEDDELEIDHVNEDSLFEVEPVNEDNQLEIDENNVDLSERFITDRIFESRRDLIDWAKETGREVGTVIVTKKSDFVTGRTPRLLLGCERAGKYRPRRPGAERKGERRKSATKLCDCPFLLKGLFQFGTQDKWKVKVDCGRHNHPLVSSNGVKSAVGRLTSEERRIVEEMSASGLKLQQALTVIKSRNPTNASTIRHIYNARATLRKIETREKTQVQQLINELCDNGYLELNRLQEDSDIVRDLFWAHPESVQLAKCFPYVFLMDSMYKTNRFKRSLFEIVGVTSTRQTFTVCFALIEEEKEDNYLWVLDKFRSLLDRDVFPSTIVTNRELALMNALEKFFPSTKLILSRWHISKDITNKAKDINDTNIQRKFMDQWDELVMAISEDDYQRCLRQLESEFSEFRSLLDYVKDTWLNPYKDCLVSAWINNHMHLGNTSANCSQGSHAKLKKQLEAGNYDILGMWKIMQPLLNLQFTDITASFELSKTDVPLKYPLKYQVNVMKDVIGVVSIAAMDIILDEKKRGGMDIMLGEKKRGRKVGVDAQACGCALRRTHGLPCAHEIIEYEKEGCAIPLSSIHPVWKKLSSSPDSPNRGGLDARPEFHLFFQHFNESCEDRKVYLLNKLKELSSQETTWVGSPEKPNL